MGILAITVRNNWESRRLALTQNPEKACFTHTQLVASQHKQKTKNTVYRAAGSTCDHNSFAGQ